MLPFEGLPLVVSQGWNAVALLFFLASALLIIFEDRLSVIKLLSIADTGRLKRLLIVAFLLILLSILAYFCEATVEKSDVIRAVITFVFGLSFLFSTSYILFVRRVQPKLVLTILFTGYSFAILVGLAQYLSLNSPVMDLLTSSSRRGGREGIQRVTFMFSEPSFASVHVTGVIIPFYLLIANERYHVRQCIALVLGFLLINIVSGSSLRLLIDSSFVAILLFLFFSRTSIVHELKLITSSRKLLYLIYVSLAILCSYLLFEDFKPEVSQINSFVGSIEDNFSSIANRVDRLINPALNQLDISGSIRRLRVDLIVVTLSKCDLESFLTPLIGVGFGNLSALTQQTCSVVFSPYAWSLSGVSAEYNSLVQDPGVRSVFSLPPRLLAEFGIVGICGIIYAIFPKDIKQLLFLSLIGVSVLGFDSYAFYGIWFYLLVIVFPISTLSLNMNFPGLWSRRQQQRRL